MYKFIFNWFLKRILRLEFVSCKDIKRLKTYLKMKDEDIVLLFKSRYTDNFSGNILANSNEEKWILKGRLLEDLDILNAIERAEDMLIDIEKYKSKQKGKEQILKTYKDFFVNKIPFKKKKGEHLIIN